MLRITRVYHALGASFRIGELLEGGLELAIVKRLFDHDVVEGFA